MSSSIGRDNHHILWTNKSHVPNHQPAMNLFSVPSSSRSPGKALRRAFGRPRRLMALTRPKINRPQLSLVAQKSGTVECDWYWNWLIWMVHDGFALRMNWGQQFWALPISGCTMLSYQNVEGYCNKACITMANLLGYIYILHFETQPISANERHLRVGGIFSNVTHTPRTSLNSQMCSQPLTTYSLFSAPKHVGNIWLILLTKLDLLNQLKSGKIWQDAHACCHVGTKPSGNRSTSWYLQAARTTQSTIHPYITTCLSPFCSWERNPIISSIHGSLRNRLAPGHIGSAQASIWPVFNVNWITGPDPWGHMKSITKQGSTTKMRRQHVE